MTKIDIINQYINNTNNRFNSPDISPNEWYLENRKGYVESIHDSFKKYQIKEKQDTDEDLDSSYIKLFPHQKFVRDYLQPKSPYNGLLLYHGLGVGKTCASIATAELLLNNRDVTVMLPASLERNYINEVMNCGSKYYSKNQYWKFIEYDDLKKLYSNNDLDVNLIQENDFIDYKLLKTNKNNGFWYTKEGKEPNYDKLDSNQKEQIYNQLYSIILKKYNVLHYNGLSTKKIAEFNNKSKTNNFFDNNLVIIDEVHNFISRVVNGSKIALELYDLLFKSKNSKLLFLSGTPIINRPYEVVLLLNVLKRYETLEKLKLNKKLDDDEINQLENILQQNRYIDTFDFDAKNDIYRIKFIPENFQKEELNNKINFNENNIDESKVELLKSLDNYDVKFEKNKLNYTGLPIKEDVFIDKFIDTEKLKVKNPELFIKRILGSVSYFEYTDSDLFPTIKENNIVKLNFSETQFKKYYDVRLDELIKEKKYRGDQSQNSDSDGSQVYKAFSRALCNFTFPDEIERPYPSKIKLILNDLTYGLDDYDEEKQIKKIEKYDNNTNFKKNNNEKDYGSSLYTKLINESLDKLVDDSQEYLVDNLKEYSPKFKSILDTTQKSPGTVLIYSQYRNVEGIGILKRVFNANGYVEFKLKKEGKRYKLDISKEDYNKPKYIEFTGDKEMNNILLAVFNNNFDNVPDNIKNKLDKLHSNNTEKDNGNLRGSIVKIIMITQSGSEGISLKNVRQVHITEPYWNKIRIDQVIGRAVRTKSHMELPKDERNINVYQYLCKFSKEQLKDPKVEMLDNSLTTDQVIFNLADRKAKTNDDVLKLLKSSAVDCHLHAKNHTNVKCFSYPIDIDDNKLMVQANIEEDDIDILSKDKETKIDLELQIVTIQGNKYMILLDEGKKNEGQLFDYDEYDKYENIKFVGLLFKNNDNKFVLKLKNFEDKSDKKPEKSDKKPDKPDKKPEKPEKPDKKPEKPDKPDKKPEKPDKPDKPDNPDKPDKPDNPDKPSKVVPTELLNGDGKIEGPNDNIAKMLKKNSRKDNIYEHVIVEQGGNPHCSYCTMAAILNQMNKLDKKDNRYNYQDIRNIIAEHVQKLDETTIRVLYQQEFGALPTEKEREDFNAKLEKMDSNDVKKDIIKRIKNDKWGTEFDFSIIKDKFKIGILIIDNEAKLYNTSSKINEFKYYTVIYFNGLHFQSVALKKKKLDEPYSYVFKCKKLPSPIIKLINKEAKKSEDIEKFKC
jgi:hypothetical protein